MMQLSYLMEGDDESQRLAIKDRTADTRDQLLRTGISQFLQSESCIVDAGAGVGVVGQQMAEIATLTSANPQLILLDASAKRLSEAENRLAPYNFNKSFIQCHLENIPLPDKSVDYLFCRFVFEYLQSPKTVFSEFIRIMKPGGKLVIGDLDNNAVSHYPLTEKLNYQIECISKELQNNFNFDYQAGRKLYSYFYENQCTDVAVHLYAHHLFYGDLSKHDEYNWTKKLEKLIELQNDGALKLDFSVAEFSKDFLDFLNSPGRFSYTPLILVEGRVHHE